MTAPIAPNHAVLHKVLVESGAAAEAGYDSYLTLHAELAALPEDWQ